MRFTKWRPGEASQVFFERDCPRLQFTYGRYTMVWVDHKIVSVTKPLVHSSDEYTNKASTVPQFLCVECGTYRKKDDYLELTTTRSA